MTNMSQALAAYGTARRAQSPLKLVVELYDVALTSVARAKMERMLENSEREFQAMRQAVRIFEELNACLNMSDTRARPVSEELRRYYQRTLRQLHAAKRTRGEAAVEGYASVHRQILAMREAWAELAGVHPLVSASSAASASAATAVPAVAAGQ